MHTHEDISHHLTAKRFLTRIVLSAILLSTSCATKPTSNEADSAVLPAYAAEYYHADNDIAMTVRSIADAIKVGEPLDSTEYDFKGVLTDGQGSPLYTDVQGAPGLWVVDVLDKQNASIKNIYLGDLLPGDLQSYILQSLHLTEEQKIDFSVHDALDDDETEISIYDFGSGYLRFETRAGIAPNGLEGPLLTIIMCAQLPPTIIMVPDSVDGGGKRKGVLAQNAAKP